MREVHDKIILKVRDAARSQCSWKMNEKKGHRSANVARESKIHKFRRYSVKRLQIIQIYISLSRERRKRLSRNDPEALSKIYRVMLISTARVCTW